jgi:hypothetical protein
MPGFGQTVVDIGLGAGELRGTVDSDQELKLSVFGANSRDIDTEGDDRVGPELLAPRPVAFHVGQSGDIVILQTSMQAGSGQLRDRGLESARLIVKRQ